MEKSESIDFGGGMERSESNDFSGGMERSENKDFSGGMERAKDCTTDSSQVKSVYVQTRVKSSQFTCRLESSLASLESTSLASLH